MQKLHFNITINAPKEKVWDTMLNDATYRQWTEAFNPGSYYEGSWDQGASIKFLGPAEEGNPSGGMFSKIKENRPYEYISIEHLGEIINGKEVVKKEWAGAHENYTFKDKNGATELLVDLDMVTGIDPNFIEMFKEMWPKALEKLKSIAEKA